MPTAMQSNKRTGSQAQAKCSKGVCLCLHHGLKQLQEHVESSAFNTQLNSSAVSAQQKHAWPCPKRHHNVNPQTLQYQSRQLANSGSYTCICPVQPRNSHNIQQIYWSAQKLCAQVPQLGHGDNTPWPCTTQALTSPVCASSAGACNAPRIVM